MKKTISPDNPEIVVQQAMIHTVYVAFDCAAIGCFQVKWLCYAKAAQLASDDLRVVFSKADEIMDSAAYFA